MKRKVLSILTALALCLSLLPTMALATGEVTEQYDALSNGTTYWFDLSGQKDTMGGTVNTALPDQSMKWVPFTYAGTVDAYVLKVASSSVSNSSNQASTATDSSGQYGYHYVHSLFIADYDLTKASWNELNSKDLIFGIDYTNGGVSYTLRAPSVGSSSTGTGDSEAVTPGNNEWDSILAKNVSIKNTTGDGNRYSWGQDTSAIELNAAYRYTRKCDGSYRSTSLPADGSGLQGSNGHYRPVLELPGDANLKVVTVNLGGGSIGTGEGAVTGSLNVVVAATATNYTPSSEGITPPDGKLFDKWTEGENTLTAQWKDSGTSYNVWVGSTQVTSDNASDVLSDGKVGYDNDTSTLTLSGANITGVHTWESGQYTHSAGIYAEGDLKIVLTGSTANTVAAETDNTYTYSIYTSGSLTISGTGTLEATGTASGDGASFGIYSTAAITIENGTITAEGSSAGGQTSNGIFATTSITINGGKGVARSSNKAMNVAPGGSVTVNGEANDKSRTWGYAENETFIVTYDGNGNTSGTAPRGGSYLTGTSVTVQNNASLAKTGYTFGGWNTKADGTGTTYAAGDTFTVTDATTLYAKWEPETVAVSGVTLDKTALTMAVSGTQQLTATVAPSNATNQAVTWESSAPSVATVSDTGIVTAVAVGNATITVETTDGDHTATCAVTVTATPVETFTITTDFTPENSGTVTGGGTYAKDTQVTLTATPNTGYQFVKWTKDSTDLDSDNPYTFQAVADVTITAVFEPMTADITHTITFNGNGGTASTSTMQTGTDGKLASLPTATRSNYTFNGWFTMATGGDKITTATVFDTDTTVYAQWTYAGGGGSSSGGSSSGGSNTTTETEKNPDGSTTTTVTNKTTGTVTETTKYPDGTVETVKTDKAGNMTETVKTPDGVTGTVVTDKRGDVTEITAEIPNQVANSGQTVTLPIEVSTVGDPDDAPVVEIEMKKHNGGVTVEIPVDHPTPGTVAVLVHPDGTEEIIKTSVVTEDGVALVLTGSANIKIVDNSKHFADVDSRYWAVDAVDFVTAREIFNGTSATTFAPELPMSRAMLAKVLHNLENNPDAGLNGIFPDVDNGAWYAEAVSWASDKGIVSGYPDGSFGAGDSVSREQLAVMLWRYAGSPAAPELALTFKDADQVSGYAEDAVRWAVSQGIIVGTDLGTLMPKASATRAQVAVMLMRYLESTK